MADLNYNHEQAESPDHHGSLDAAQDALNRMARAANRGTGCYLTFEMIQSLSLTIIGEMWSQDDPRTKTKENHEHEN